MVTFLDEIKQQPEALIRLNEEYFVKTPSFVAEIEQLNSTFKFDNVLFSGMGSSLFAGHLGAMYLRKNGIPATAMESYELEKHGEVLLNDHTLFVAISQSGNSEELVDVVRKGIHKGKTIVITNYTTGELYPFGDIKVLLHAGVEYTTATKSFTNTLAATLSVVSAIVGNFNVDSNNFSALLKQCAKVTEDFIYNRENEIRAMGDMLMSAKWVPLVASGASYQTASHAELVLEEAAKVYCSRFTCGQFIHGPIETIDENVCVLLLDNDDTMRDRADRVINATITYKGKIVVLTNRKNLISQENMLVIKLDVDDNFFATLAEIIPIELAVNYIGFAKGGNPGILTRVRKIIK